MSVQQRKTNLADTTKIQLAGLLAIEKLLADKPPGWKFSARATTWLEMAAEYGYIASRNQISLIIRILEPEQPQAAFVLCKEHEARIPEVRARLQHRLRTVLHGVPCETQGFRQLNTYDPVLGLFDGPIPAAGDEVPVE